MVETTNRCSLSCVHCSVSEQGHPHHAQVGFIDPTLFEALIDDLVRFGARFDALIPFWLGEPLLHPHFGHLWRHALRAAARHGTFRKVEVHTNATHLTAARAAAICNDADVSQVWHISLDAASQATYTRIKGRDRFDKVVENTLGLLRLKAQRRARWPRVVFQFIASSNNISEVAAFRDQWTRACQELGQTPQVSAGHVPPGEAPVVFFRQRDCPTPEQQEHENRVFREAMTGLGLALPAASARGNTVLASNLTPCSAFWKSPVVSWRGDVTTCTRDNLLENRIGSLYNAPFSELWWGPEMSRRRAAVARGDYRGLPPCTTCFIPRSLNHAELSAEDVERQARYDQGRHGTRVA